MTALLVNCINELSKKIDNIENFIPDFYNDHSILVSNFDDLIDKIKSFTLRQ